MAPLKGRKTGHTWKLEIKGADGKRHTLTLGKHPELDTEGAWTKARGLLSGETTEAAG